MRKPFISQAVRYAAWLLLALAGSLPLPAQTAATGSNAGTAAAPVAPKQLHSFDSASLDKTVDPCTDFYRYACGGWLKANPIAADAERVMVFGQLQDRNDYLLYTELEQAAAAPKTPLETQYGTFFAACMDVDRANALGAEPLRPTLEAIAAIPGKAGIAGFLGDRRTLGAGFFTLAVEQDEKDAAKQIAVLKQDGLTLPAPDYYLASGSEQASAREQLRRYLLMIFQSLGDKPSEADAEANSVLQIETALAGATMARVDARDPEKTYHPSTVAQLQALTPGFEWRAYFNGVRPPPLAALNVAQPEYLKTMARVIAGTPLPALKSYLRIHAVTPVAPWLSAPFEQASFALFNKALRGQAVEQARWKRCTALTDKQLSDAVGQQWAKRNFSPENKAAMEQIAANVRAAFGEEIAQLPWLSPSARQEAERKLAAMGQHIGYPGHWRDYSGLHLGSTDFVADLHAAQVFNRDDALARIGKPLADYRWFWTVSTADANYDEHRNAIEYPAGILQPPWYSQSVDPAVNYGAIGTLAGHEMTHGFDDVGSRYDEGGNLRDWFTPADRAAFDRMTSCEVKEYGRFDALPGLKLDGRLSLGENTADNGGLRIAYKAFQKVSAQAPERAGRIDGYTEDQRFFLGFAQTWCEHRRDEYQRVRGQTDPHPPGEFRVNGTVQNFVPFGEAFGCRRGQPMMPVDACHVW